MGVALSLIRVMETNPKLALYKAFIYCKIYLKQLYLSKKTERFSYKVECGVRERMRVEALKVRVGLGYSKQLWVVSNKMLVIPL